jgi:carbamoyl-phosphate synthase large subunit
MTQVTLLFSSAGRRVELIRCFRNAAKDIGADLKIIAIDMDPSWSPACQIADQSYRVPHCNDTEFINHVASICKKHNVNLIIPTIDTELIIYAKSKEFLGEIGTGTMVSSEEFVRITRDKEATAKILSFNGITTPLTWSINEAFGKAACLTYPLILKPKSGSCSKGISIINNKDELNEKIELSKDYVLQEVCTGREFTINCFYDPSGACVACVPHYRKFVRDGEVCFAETERVHEFTDIAHKLSKIFNGIYGSVCFQAFRSEEGKIKVFEINARFGGGYPICDQAGGTFAKWLMQDLIGQAPDYNDNWDEGVRMLRYDEAVFIKKDK